MMRTTAGGSEREAGRVARGHRAGRPAGGSARGDLAGQGVAVHGRDVRGRHVHRGGQGPGQHPARRRPPFRLLSSGERRSRSAIRRQASSGCSGAMLSAPALSPRNGIVDRLFPDCSCIRTEGSHRALRWRTIFSIAATWPRRRCRRSSIRSTGSRCRGSSRPAARAWSSRSISRKATSSTPPRRTATTAWAPTSSAAASSRRRPTWRRCGSASARNKRYGVLLIEARRPLPGRGLPGHPQADRGDRLEPLLLAGRQRHLQHRRVPRAGRGAHPAAHAAGDPAGDQARARRQDPGRPGSGGKRRSSSLVTRRSS